MKRSNDTEATLSEDVGDGVDFHDTTDPDEIFRTTHTRLELALKNYDEVIDSKYRWINSLVLFITALSVVLAANFEKTFGLSATLWSNVFSAIALISLFYCIRDGYRWYSNRESESTEAVMKELRKDTSDES